MHPADGLAEAEASASPRLISGRKILNAKAPEVPRLVPVIPGQPFSVAVTDPQADECWSLHCLESRLEREGCAPHALDGADVTPQALPVEGLEHSVALITTDQEQIEEDTGFLSAQAPITAVLANLPHQGLQQRSPALCRPALKELGRCTATVGTPLAK